MPEFPVRLLIVILLYLVSSKAALSLRNVNLRMGIFALINIAAIGAVFYWNEEAKHLRVFAIYVGLVCGLYLCLRTFVRRAGPVAWLAALAPLLLLILVKYMLPIGRASSPIVLGLGLGLSYVAFRLSHLAFEVRNGVIARPSLGQYLSFSFFLPVFFIGPITHYSLFERSAETPSAEETPLDRSLLRIIIGLLKFQFLANLINQLSYSGLLLDGHSHSVQHFIVAVIAYYLYLYCNFSGFCDMAIGLAGLLRIRVLENFDNPFIARNLQEYWNRWHMTLSGWMRDILFSPLCKILVGWLGPKSTPHVVAFGVFVVFLTVGIWHGPQWNYFLFGLAHGIGLTIHHYYGIFLKRKLSKDQFRAYIKSPFTRWAATAVTFCYVAVALFLFANDLSEMKQILTVVRW